jgi:hypothetical protein
MVAYWDILIPTKQGHKGTLCLQAIKQKRSAMLLVLSYNIINYLPGTS